MDAEEVKKLIEGLKAVAKASGTVIEEGTTYIKIGKCTIEMVHTDMVKEMLKEPVKLNSSNMQSNPFNSYSQAFTGFLPCGFPRNLVGCAGCPNMHSVLCPRYNPPVPPMPGAPNF